MSYASGPPRTCRAVRAREALNAHWLRWRRACNGSKAAERQKKLQGLCTKGTPIMTVKYNQTGYIGLSRSERAEAAIQRGCLPWSHLKTEHLKAHGITETKAFVKYLADTGRIQPTEWHHSGKYATEVNHWDPAHIKQQLDNIPHEKLDTYREEHKQARAPQQQTETTRVAVTYRDWVSRKRYEIITHRAATLDGNWLRFDNGTKKQAHSGSIINISHTHPSRAAAARALHHTIAKHVTEPYIKTRVENETLIRASDGRWGFTGRTSELIASARTHQRKDNSKTTDRAA